MAVTQYQPTTDRFGSLLEDLFRPVGRGNGVQGLLRAPEADVVETEDQILVVMDAPGMSPGDIDLGLENNVLTVSGERRPEWSEEEGGRRIWHLAERRYGRFSRAFVLPRDVDQDRIEARFEDGVLTVVVPKSERARRRRIEITRGDTGKQAGRVEVGKGGK